ncbi:MAG: PilZ domain-containing protein [Sphingobium sp.]|uniref:PilZ domain-containing protein n=1 Tax=Sphingobium sp. TaxID=1912891 RepID=UPI0029AD5F94|nr:PilZ domain-containing protein [Sphingobium sp.]MDX3909181.1 PilZ domain-containing protein [Sphingobium sp.]
MTLSLRRLFGTKPTFSRSAARYACKLEGSLMVIDRMASFEGRVIDLSSGGAMFRPRLAYLMDRRDVPICLTVGPVEVFGRIMSTSPQGFGLRFDEPIEEEELSQMLALEAPAMPKFAARAAAR